MARLYQAGEGVTQDYSEAAKWYRRASEQGHVDAQYNLSLTYYSGEGVNSNTVMAYMLAVLTAAKGDEEARHNRNIILNQLTREQVAEGQRFASEWRVGTPLPTYSDFSTQ